MKRPSCTVKSWLRLVVATNGSRMYPFQLALFQPKHWRAVPSKPLPTSTRSPLVSGPEPKEAKKMPDRKSGVEGKRVSVRVDIGGRRIIKKKNQTEKRYH